MSLIEQEFGSIAKFILDSTQSPYSYYDTIPESFMTPAIYFPPHEIRSGGDTLTSFSTRFVWFVKFLAPSTLQAQSLAKKALFAIKEKHNLIPLVDNTGNSIGRGIRVADPTVSVVDTGVVQLRISFVMHRSFSDRSNVSKATVFVATNYGGETKYITPDVADSAQLHKEDSQ